MLRLSIRHALSGLILGCASLAATAQTTITFDNTDPSIYGDGQTYADSGFTFTQVGDFGSIDGPLGFSLGAPPSGNDSQFYSAFNDTAVSLTRGGGLFGLTGFDAGFIAPSLLDEGYSAGLMIVSAVNSLGATVTHTWDFGLSASDGSFAFLTLGSAADFSAFGSIRSALFSACVYLDDGSCSSPYQNLAQFAIDNVHVMAPVPEPETYALLAFGLAALAYRRRRQTR